MDNTPGWSEGVWSEGATEPKQVDNIPGWSEGVTEPKQVVEDVRSSKPRSRTDFFFFILNLGFIVVLLVLFGYCFFNGSIYRLLNGYDTCGNVCGLKNGGNTDQSCSNPDKRNKKITMFLRDTDIVECVPECPQDYVQQKKYCFPIEDSTDWEISEKYLNLDVIAISLFVAVGFAYIFIVLLLYATKIVIWFAASAFVVMVFIISFLCFYLGFWIEAAADIVIGLTLLLLFVKRKEKMKFVIKLFKETATSLKAIPLLLFEPLLTVLSAIIATCFFVYFDLVISTAGTFNKDLFEFEQNAAIRFTYWLNFIVYFWFVQFIIGCQHFVIASTVSQWYFSRNKSLVRRPIRNAFSDLIVFHLGTICLGSLLLPILMIIRWIIHSMKRYIRMPNCMESAIISLSNDAYIVTAIDGLPFIAAGKRSVNLMVTNFGEKITSELVGGAGFWICKFTVFFISMAYVLLKVFEGEDVTDMAFYVALLVALLAAHVIIGAFESTVDSLFICYSIDLDKNNGGVRQLFMSDSLKNAMIEAKQLATPQPQQV